MGLNVPRQEYLLDHKEIIVQIRPEHRKTFPNTRIAETLLMFIRSQGGEHAAVDAAFIPVPLADYYGLPEESRTLSRSAYYVNDNVSGQAWDCELQGAAKELKRDGYLVAANCSGHAVWSLTASGLDRADFWMKRMLEKTTALKALSVDSELVWKSLAIASSGKRKRALPTLS
ncbi:MAG TPA: hypothetical protein VNH44_12480 [Micropepsaceae bacterium]|nr:hypothetical protein [Micropepsaceae bacterium]